MSHSTATTDQAKEGSPQGKAATQPNPVPFMSLALEQADIDAAVSVLHSGILRQGSRCAELETRFAAQTGATHGLTCSNGTTALQLAYGALLQPGDDVLVPAWTYIATASMLVAAGCNPIFVDCLEDTFQIDVEDAEKRITPNTKAIAATHLYGMPVDIDAVEDLAKRKGLRIIYDSAQAHLATYKGKGLGTFGDANTYSFYATKNLATGEGGMVTVNDETLNKDIAALRSHGETDKYLHTRIGFNYRMNDITAAIGCSRLDRLEAQTNTRRQNANRYDAMLADIPGLQAPTRTEGAESAWHLYTVKMDLSKFSMSRDDFCAKLKEQGVPTAIHYPRGLTRQPAFDPYVTEHPKVADSLSAKVFSLPMHHDLTDEHFGQIGRALTDIANSNCT